MFNGLTLFVSWGIKNTAAPLELMQEKPYINAGARAFSIARALE